MQLPVVNSDIQIRFSDIDPLGHVSNGVYTQYLDLGRIDFFYAIGGDLPTTVVANITMDFLAEINFRDKVVVKTWCAKKGNKSIHIAQSIYANNICVTKATVIVVGVNRDTRKTVPLLEGWSESIV